MLQSARMEEEMLSKYIGDIKQTNALGVWLTVYIVIVADPSVHLRHIKTKWGNGG